MFIPASNSHWEIAYAHGMLDDGRVPLPVGRAGFKPVGGRFGVLGRFDSCLFRSPLRAEPVIVRVGTHS